jgi:aryl-alcohol dehydrogenase-like predicted oxidoreductase
VYADGVSEDHLGETLSDLGARPMVGTKVVIGADELDDVSGAVIRCFESSLKRLRLDSVDILHLHNRLALQREEGSNVGIGPLLSVDDLLGPGGVLEAFEKLRDQGKTRSLGICSFGGEVPAINQAIDTGHFQSLLAYYNILNPTAARKPPAGFEDYDYGAWSCS